MHLYLRCNLLSYGVPLCIGSMRICKYYWLEDFHDFEIYLMAFGGLNTALSLRKSISCTDILPAGIHCVKIGRHRTCLGMMEELTSPDTVFHDVTWAP